MDNQQDSENVALPGAGVIEPTILEALNRNIASDSGSEPQTQTESHPEENKTEISNQPDDETLGNAQSGNSSPGDLNADRPEAFLSDEQTSDDVDGSHILEIESHLIETLENYSVSEQSDTSGVTVEEVPPAKEELSKTSTAESETSPKTVIEIQPSLPKLHKSVESEVHQSVLEPEVGFAAGSRRPSENLTEKEDQSTTSSPEFKVKINESLCDTEKTLQEPSGLESSAKNKLNKVEIVTPVEIQKDLIWSQPHVEETVEQIKNANKDDSTPKTVQLSERNESSVKNEKLDELQSNRTKDNKSQEIEDTKTTKEEQQGDQRSVKDSDAFQSKSTEGDPSELQLEDTNIINSENITKSSISNEPLKYVLKADSTQLVTETTQEPLQEQEPSSVKKDSDIIRSPPEYKAVRADEEQLSKDELTTAVVVVVVVDESSKDGPQQIEVEHLQTSEHEKQADEPQLGINGLPISTTQSEEEAKKSFLESIPQLNESEANTLSTQAKKEYYQSLRDYLIKEKENRPPVPLQTYRWEDLRRAKQQGGYPWTHIYKRPLGPDEEPEIILLLRKSQELQRLPSESPKSLKKVRIHDQVLVKETERYISDLSDTENTEEDKEDNKSVQSESASASESEGKKGKTSKIRGILKRGRSKLAKLDLSPSKSKASESEPATKSTTSPKKIKCCPPIMDKLKNMADKQLKKRHIKKVPLKSDEKIVLSEEQKILKLKTSPKAERSEIPHFVEKQDSDEILEIVDLEESPSKIRKRREELAGEHPASSVLVPDEIIEIPQTLRNEEPQKTEEVSHPTPEPTVSEILDEELKSSPPQKAPRKKKEHVYEDIDNEELGQKIDEILEEAIVGALKRSLATQDEAIRQDMDVRLKLEKMGSSEEDPDKTLSRLAPLSSIDSASSEDERKPPLSALAEESDQESSPDDLLSDKETDQILKIVEEHEKEELLEPELKSVLKREPSPGSDKKVTFSHVEDEAEPHREDIELPEHVILDKSRWSNIRYVFSLIKVVTYTCNSPENEVNLHIEWNASV